MQLVDKTESAFIQWALWIELMDRKRSKKPSSSSRRDFIQKSLLTGGIAAGSGFYSTLLKVTEAFAESATEQQSQNQHSLFLNKLQDEVDPLNRKALWAGPLKGGGDGDKYGGIMEEPMAKKK